jgi:hypothetical protein
MSRDTRTAYRARAAATERSIDAALAEVKAAKTVQDREAAAEYAARISPAIPFTDEELKAARVVRTRYGWNRVIRVNTKTVTVSGDFGDHRIPTTTILEVRA